MSKKDLGEGDHCTDEEQKIRDLIDDMATMPRLRRNLRLVLYLLVTTELTLVEVCELLRPGGASLREYLPQDIRSDFDLAEWQDILKLTPRQFDENFGTTLSRLAMWLKR